MQGFSKIFNFIVKGLSNYYWDVYLDDDVSIEVMALASAGEDFFQKTFFSLNSKAHVVKDLGENTFWYEGAQAVDCPQITIWRFSIYNGLKLAGDPKASEETTSLFGAFSGPKHIFKSAKERMRT